MLRGARCTCCTSTSATSTPHYTGKAASSGLLRALWWLGGGEFAELAPCSVMLAARPGVQEPWTRAELPAARIHGELLGAADEVAATVDAVRGGIEHPQVVQAQPLAMPGQARGAKRR